MHFLKYLIVSSFIFSATIAQECTFDQAATPLIAKADEHLPNWRSEGINWQNQEKYDALLPHVSDFLYAAFPHLTRPFTSDLVDTDGNLTVSQKELEVYMLLSNFHQYSIPYRSSQFAPTFGGEKRTFRTGGTPPSALTFPRSSGTTQILKDQDIYHIRYALIDFELASQMERGIQLDAQFALFPNFKDYHATTIITILDPNSHTALLSIFINSWISVDYLQYISERFNYRNYYTRFMSNPDTVKERQIPNAIIRDDSVTFNHYVPLMDASMTLQLAKDDSNCALYSYNMIQALSNALTDDTFKSTLLALAQDIYKNRNNDAQVQPETDSIKQVRDLIQSAIISRLTQYFDADGNRRSDEELRTYHDQMRWELGTQFLQLLAKK